MSKMINNKFNDALIKREKGYQLPIIQVGKDLRKRFKGELICMIRFASAYDYKNMEVYDNKQQSREENIKTYFQGDMKNGIPDGNGKLFWKDGTLLYEGEFRKGKISGFGTTYFRTGSISEKGYRVDGLLNGECTCYYENGKIEYNGNKKDGEEDGYGVSYFEDGSLMYRGICDEGWAVNGLTHRLKNGMLYKYNDDGQYIVNEKGDILKSITEEEYQILIS